MNSKRSYGLLLKHKVVVIITWDASPPKEMSCQPNVPFFGNVSESQKHMGATRKTYNDGDSYLDINDLVFMYRFKTRNSLQKWLVCCPSSLKAHNFAFPHFCRPYSCHGCLFRESCPRFRESPCRWFLLLAPGGRNSTQSRMHS